MRNERSLGRWRLPVWSSVAILGLCAGGLACGVDAASPEARATPDSTRPRVSPPTPGCRAAPVSCDEAPPACDTGEVPEVDPCPLGHCPGRCWTGRCVPCADECRSDADCELVGRHGCCGDAGDCADGCFWAEPRGVRAADVCYFAATCPIPAEIPSGCPTACTPDPRCGACPHCGPQAARCEAGACTAAWPTCEPDCLCD